jgi:hypothetical protein
MNYEAFKKKRNEEYALNVKKGLVTTPLQPCNYCGYKPKTYMDLVEHREDKHGIKRGEGDINT